LHAGTAFGGVEHWAHWPWQLSAPELQPQVPVALQTWLVPHGVPTIAKLVESTQVAAPPTHATVPRMQGREGLVAH
jgi:hypothetical protein